MGEGQVWKAYIEEHSRVLDVYRQGYECHGYAGSCQGDIDGEESQPGLEVIAAREGPDIPYHASANHEEAEGGHPCPKLYSNTVFHFAIRVGKTCGCDVQ